MASSQRASTSRCRKPELERPEGDVVEDGGAEELDVGILEDQAHLAMESEGVDAVDDRRHIQAEGPHPAAGRRDDPVEELEERGLAAPVRPEQDDLLARPHHQVDPVERDLAARRRRSGRRTSSKIGSARGSRTRGSVTAASVRRRATAATPSAVAPASGRPSRPRRIR